MEPLYILDRWEGDMAIVEVTDREDRTHWQPVERKSLPEEAREGDVLLFTGQSWKVDEQATQTRRKKMADRLARLNHRRNP